MTQAREPSREAASRRPGCPQHSNVHVRSMARVGRPAPCRRTHAGAPIRSGLMAESRPSLSMRLVGIAAVVVVAWVLLWPVLSIVRSIVAFALYIVVAVVAYQVGKLVGRTTHDEA